MDARFDQEKWKSYSKEALIQASSINTLNTQTQSRLTPQPTRILSVPTPEPTRILSVPTPQPTRILSVPTPQPTRIHEQSNPGGQPTLRRSKVSTPSTLKPLQSTMGPPTIQTSGQDDSYSKPLTSNQTKHLTTNQTKPAFTLIQPQLNLPFRSNAQFPNCKLVHIGGPNPATVHAVQSAITIRSQDQKAVLANAMLNKEKVSVYLD